MIYSKIFQFVDEIDDNRFRNDYYENILKRVTSVLRNFITYMHACLQKKSNKLLIS